MTHFRPAGKVLSAGGGVLCSEDLLKIYCRHVSDNALARTEVLASALLMT